MFRKNEFPAFVLLLFLTARLLPCQTAANPAVFDGQVMNRSNGRPLAGVEVTLLTMVRVSQEFKEIEYSAISSTDGRFVISGIAPGEYSISVARQGYSPDDSASSTSLPKQRFAPGESAHSVLFMLPKPIITGRVLDSNGAPVEHADVHAISTDDSQYAVTDDRGEFRIVTNGAGSYLVKAAPDKHAPPEIRRDGTKPVVYGLTYFQSSRSPASAAWVTTQFGQESSVEIKLQPAPRVQVSGTVFGLPPGEKALLWLEGIEEIRAVTDQKGRFTFWRVPAGRYHLQATVNGGGGAKWNLNTREPRLNSRNMTIDVGAASIDEIHLEVTPPVTLKFKFRDADWETYKAKLEGVSFKLRGVDQSVEGSPEDNGEFSMDNLTSGRYHVFAVGLPKNLYVKALRNREGQLTRSTLEVGNAPEQQVEIELGTDGAEISGAVRSKAGETTEAEVFLLDDEDPDLVEVKTTTTETDGHYLFHGVAPGKYRLLAHAKDGSFFLRQAMSGHNQEIINNPETKELFRTAMEKIEVTAVEKASKDLKIY